MDVRDSSAIALCSPRLWVAAVGLTLFANPSLVLADSTSVFEPVSATAASIRDLFYMVLAITGGIFLVVEGALFYCVFKYRQSSDVDTATAQTEPPQIYGSRPVEVAWTVAPLLTVFVLFLVVFRSIMEVRKDDPPPDAMVVDVIGRQWWWEYHYPKEGVRTANELHLPVGDDGKPQPVYLNLLSVDVVHSFWVPRLSGKTDLLPGRKNFMWFTIDKPGVYWGQCAEYCGTQHGNMLLKVVAEPRADFEKWVADQKKNAVDVAAGEKGKKLFLGFACVNCHTVRGTAAKGTAGPDLTHLMSRETLASGMVENTRENLVKWVFDAQSVKPGCLMPSLHVSEEEAGEIANYLETLK